MTPVPDPHLPALSLSLDVQPARVQVGDAFTATLTVANLAPDPALGLTISLPTPLGATGLLGGTWALPRLEAHAQFTVTARLRVPLLPPGRALVLRPQALAAGLDLPATATGGVLVSEVLSATSRTHFTPGAAALLRSSVGQTEVQFPAAAYTQDLTLQASQQPPAGTAAPRTWPASGAVLARSSSTPPTRAARPCIGLPAPSPWRSITRPINWRPSGSARPI